MDNNMEKVREELICAVCLDFLREPKVLFCAHSFCLQCLRGLVRSQKLKRSSAAKSVSLECPSCRHVTVLEHGRVDLDLRTNFNLKRLVHIVSDKEKNRTLKILQRRSNRRARFQCSERSPLCKLHRQPPEVFCQDCNEVVCQTCTRTGHKTHAHCTLQELENLLEEKATALRNVIQPCCEVASMADQQMQALHKDRDTVLANSDTTRSAVTLFFLELRKALEQREKAVLNTVQKYTDIKLTTLDLHHQKLQEDHMAIMRAKESLETLLHQNNTQLDCSLLVMGQTLEDELEVHQNSVLTVCDTLNQEKYASKFLSFSGDQVLLSEPLKEAGVLNECQRIPDTNILSMQRVVVSEEEDPYLHVPSRFEDLQTNGPQEEVRIDGRKKSQRVMKMSDMVEDENVQYQLPRDFLSSPPPGEKQSVRSLAEGLFQETDVPMRVKQQPGHDDAATIDCQPCDELAAEKLPPPLPRRTRAKTTAVPPPVTPRKPPPQKPAESSSQGSSKHSPPLLPPKPSEESADDVYDVPRSVLQEGGDGIYSIPRSLLQDEDDHDIYNVPRSIMQDDAYNDPQLHPQNPISEDTYDVPRKLLASPVPSPPHTGLQQPNNVSRSFSPGDSLPPPRPPKSPLLSPSPCDDPVIPQRAPSPKPKPRTSTIPYVDYVNTDFSLLPNRKNGTSPVPSTHPPVKQNLSHNASTVSDIRSKPIPTPRPRRSHTTVAGVRPPLQQPPQSAPPTEGRSKQKFQWDGKLPSAHETTHVKTLPPDMKLRPLGSTIMEPIAMITSQQLSQTVSSEQVYPCGVCCSPITDLLVMTDVYNHCIRLVDPVLGRAIERIGKEGRLGGQFKEPSAVVMDNNENIFVAELDNPRVQKFTSHGKYLLKFGQKAFWGSQLHDPYGLALSPDNRLYITDWEKGRILVYQKDGRHVSTIGKDHAFLKFPAGLAFDKKGNLLVTDRGKHCVWVMSPEGKPIGRIGKIGTGDGEMLLPHGVTVLKDNTIAVSESGNHRVSIFAPNGHFIRSFGGKGSRPGMFHYPRHMCVDSKGQLIVADEHNQRIQIFEVC